MNTSQDEQKATLDRLFSKRALFATVDSTEMAPNLEPIWGNWLFRQSVVFEVGDPGISKTTLNYALASQLVNHKPFFGVDGHHIEGTMRVLYLDLESSDSLIKSRKNLLGVSQNPNFLKCNFPNVTLRDLEPYIDKLVEEWGELSLVFVDPIRMAFNLRNENANAEASRNMKYVRKLADKWGCAVILVHHSTKAELEGVRKGSGAFAWACLSDIVWNFERLGDEYEPELFKFYIPKSRMIQDDFCVCVRKGEGGFEVEDFPSGYQSFGSGIGVYSLQQAVDLMTRGGKEWGPQEIMDSIEKLSFKTTRPTFYKALTALMQLGVMKRTGYGKYRNTRT